MFIANTSKVSIIPRDCLNGFNDYSSSRSIQLRLGARAAERRTTSLLFKKEKKKRGKNGRAPPRTVVDRISADDDGQPDGDSGNECNGRKVSIGRIISKRGFSSQGEMEERERGERGEEGRESNRMMD